MSRGRSSFTSVFQAFSSTPHLLNLVRTPQVTNDAKTSIGVDIHRESIFIAHIVTDEDGSLKIKKIEDFTDSKAHSDVLQATAAAEAKKQ